MKKETYNTFAIVLYFIAAFISSNVLDTTFWHILSVAFLIAGTYGIVCQSKNKKFIF